MLEQSDEALELGLYSAIRPIHGDLELIEGDQLVDFLEQLLAPLHQRNAHRPFEGSRSLLSLALGLAQEVKLKSRRNPLHLLVLVVDALHSEQPHQHLLHEELSLDSHWVTSKSSAISLLLNESRLLSAQRFCLRLFSLASWSLLSLFFCSQPDRVA